VRVLECALASTFAKPEQERCAMSQDALSYKYGRSRTARDSAYKFLLAIGPVGGTHYLVRWLDEGDEGEDAGERVIPLSTLEDFAFFPSEEDARNLPDEA
jgi:hypothetical protein